MCTDINGRLKYLDTAAERVTGRRRRRRAGDGVVRLRAARLLASIVESSDDAIVSKSLDGIIQSWNSGAERVFGYTAEQAIGSHISLIIPPAHRFAQQSSPPERDRSLASCGVERSQVEETDAVV